MNVKIIFITADNGSDDVNCVPVLPYYLVCQKMF